MTSKKPVALLALAGACALAIAAPASLASPQAPAPQADPGPASPQAATPAAPVLPVGDESTALTSKSGETLGSSSSQASSEEDPARVVGIIVRLQDGADRAASLASINEAVAGAFPGTSAEVTREYSNTFSGVALKAPAGSLDAIRAASGVQGAFIDRETHVSDVAGVDAEGGFQATRLADQNPDNLSAQVIMHADQVSQRGQGKVVAIIDTGVDMTHPAFAGTLSGTPALSADKVASLTPQLGGGKDGVYVNEKFPFAYDYADEDNNASPLEPHGTHVAGIAAANAGEIMGMAPDAQIIVAKVEQDGGGMLDSALLAALDDMAILHPDVVNLSLGQDAGMDNAADSLYAGIFETLQDKGIIVDVAAGNAFSSGYGNASGKNLPYASDPDSSTLGEPATYSPTLSVASLDNLLSVNAFTAAGKNIAYQRARGEGGGEIPQIAEMPPGDYEYVDGGFGTREDVAALRSKYPQGLDGKIVLVSRGQMTFQEKIDNLTSLKPAAILVYNNVPGDALSVMSLTTLEVPAGFISQADGQAMLAAADHHLTLVEGLTVRSNAPYSMSDFSSWGVSPDLRLKPEVTAPGGNIYSSLPEDSYGFMSGTSMATPQLTGASALVLQRVQSDSLFASMDARHKSDVVQNLLMGTATPVIDPLQDTGAYYSPRKQGAGLVNVLAATTSSVYPSVVGAADPSRPKADLGDGTTGWHFDVTLHNLSGVAATYEMNSQALSESVEGGFFTGHSSDWRGRGVAISYSGAAVRGTGESATVTVPASGEVTVGVDVTPGSEFARYVSDNAPSGTFLEGFVRFTSRTQGQADLTVPYLGFYGDWGKPAIFDSLASDGDGHILASSISATDGGNPLGYNPLAKDSERSGRPNASKYVISRSDALYAPNAIYPKTGTLRSVHTMTTTYTNGAGEVVASYESHQNWKSTLNPSSGAISPVEQEHAPRFLDLTSDEFKDLPDGNYKLTIAAHNDGPSPTEQSISYDFRVDTTPPVVEGVVYHEGDFGGSDVSIDVSDDSPIAGVTMHDPGSGLWFYRYVADNDSDQLGADGRYHVYMSVSLGDIALGWQEQGSTEELISHPYILAWDYGLNHSEAVTVDLHTDNPGVVAPCTNPEGGHWVRDSIGWWYQCAGGTDYLKGGWFTINGVDYQFGPTGYMVTGFLQRANGEWVYADSEGALVGGWVRDGAYGGPYWYYLDPATKVMRTGWLSDGGSWYYLHANGVMAIGWVQVDGSWYYLKASGAMATGWVKVGGSWYYLGPDGAMFTGTHTINGRVYTFDESGAWQR